MKYLIVFLVLLVSVTCYGKEECDNENYVICQQFEKDGCDTLCGIGSSCCYPGNDERWYWSYSTQSGWDSDASNSEYILDGSRSLKLNSSYLCFNRRKKKKQYP